MSIPIYIIATCIVLFTFIVTITLYFQAYKRHINQALIGNLKTRSPMMPPYKITVILSIVLLVISVLISYFAGYTNAYKAYEEDIWVLAPSDIQTFYAEIQGIEDNQITVKGNSFNDETNQTLMEYEVFEEQVSIYKQEETLSLSDLSKGDLILITLLTNRSGTGVFKIQVVEKQ
ncbi:MULTISPECIES: hypothetical protein [unclassified Exiguobacterium]|uniref:hypothetical protein n=1 Tax=unclassified Exiguobacterium TaxID=2644629 RepID=UPI0020371B1A|nr:MULTISPECIES: hypothetical protein [unclassified Exiguobacterium]